jgi:nucleotide-binding universal stress UspA family protein
MIQFKKIFVTTDLSENSNAAVPYAAELARRYDGRLELIYVFEDILYFPTAPEPGSYAIDPVQIMESARIERKKQLDLAAKLCSEMEKVEVKPVLLEGHPPTKIIKYATEQKPDCLVVATHGRTGLSHLVFGSVAERLVRMSVCPVLSIRPQKIVPAK